MHYLLALHLILPTNCLVLDICSLSFHAAGLRQFSATQTALSLGVHSVAIQTTTFLRTKLGCALRGPLFNFYPGAPKLPWPLEPLLTLDHKAGPRQERKVARNKVNSGMEGGYRKGPEDGRRWRPSFPLQCDFGSLKAQLSSVSHAHCFPADPISLINKELATNARAPLHSLRNSAAFSPPLQQYHTVFITSNT